MSKLPTFIISDQDERTWQSSDLKGNWAVLYAYPKAMTPGCTQETRDFRDLAAKFKKLQCFIFGISADTVDRQKTFAEKENISFPLLADTEKELVQALGIWIEKSMYGRKYMGIERSTFLIDPTGTIVHRWPKASVPGHAAAVYATLHTLVTSA